jgi:hypothetical protein
MRGSTLTIVEAPIVAEGIEWYFVEFSGGMRGYIGNQDDARWLEPVSMVTPLQTTFRCESGNLASVLEIGQQGFPSFGWGDSTLRTLPGGRAIIDIPEGVAFTVIDGPHCTANGTMWFQVLYDEREGWISQGNDENGYWITPLDENGDPDTSVPTVNGDILEITQAGSRLNARAQPSTTATSLALLFWGDRVLWNGNIVSGDNYEWLEVNLANGNTAYIVNDPAFFAERDPALSMLGLSIDATIRITADGDGMHLRDTTSTRSREVKTLFEGEILTVIGGPVYSEFYLWWQLRLADGRTGYAVEVPGWWRVQ